MFFAFDDGDDEYGDDDGWLMMMDD